MLVLTRKVGERILIGDDIVITVLDSRGDGVRIGIDAPRGVKIQREEVVQAVTEANVEAAARLPTTPRPASAPRSARPAPAPPDPSSSPGPFAATALGVSPRRAAGSRRLSRSRRTRSATAPATARRSRP